MSIILMRSFLIFWMHSVFPLSVHSWWPFADDPCPDILETLCVPSGTLDFAYGVAENCLRIQHLLVSTRPGKSIDFDISAQISVVHVRWNKFNWRRVKSSFRFYSQFRCAPHAPYTRIIFLTLTRFRWQSFNLFFICVVCVRIRQCSIPRRCR